MESEDLTRNYKDLIRKGDRIRNISKPTTSEKELLVRRAYIEDEIYGTRNTTVFLVEGITHKSNTRGAAEVDNLEEIQERVDFFKEYLEVDTILPKWQQIKYSEKKEKTYNEVLSDIKDNVASLTDLLSYESIPKQINSTYSTFFKNTESFQVLINTKRDSISKTDMKAINAIIKLIDSFKEPFKSTLGKEIELYHKKDSFIKELETINNKIFDYLDGV